MLTSALSGCGHDPAPPSRSSAPSPTAELQDNRTLSAVDLAAAATEAMESSPRFRAEVDLRRPGFHVRARVEAGDEAVRLTGRFGEMHGEVIDSGVVYLKPSRWDGFGPAEEAALRSVLRGRWVRARDVDDEVREIYFVVRDVTVDFVHGGPERPKPVLGEPRVVHGAQTISYRYPNGITVYVPESGTPLPVRIETPDGSVEYADYGAQVVVDVPDIGSTMSYDEFADAFS